MLSASAAQCVI